MVSTKSHNTKGDPIENQRGTRNESRDSRASGAQTHRVWFAILALLSSWSYAAIWAGNSDSLAGFQTVHYMGWLGLFLGFAYLVAFAVHLIVPEPAGWERSYAVAAISLVMVQAWDRIASAVSGLGADVGELTAWALFTIAVALVVLLTLRLIPSIPGIRAGFGIFAAFLAGAHLISALVFGMQGVAHAGSTPPEAFTVTVDTQAPDVLVMVLDGYGRSDVLLNQFGLDNEPFHQELQSLGLQIITDAKATYTMTALSVAGLLDARYPATEGIDVRLTELHEIHSGDNLLFRSLSRAGYEVHMFDNAWTFTRCHVNVDVCYSGGLNELDAAVADRTPLPRLLPSMRIDPWIRGSVSQLRRAVSVAGSDTERPRLIYLHALVPHPPFQLTSDCGTVSDVADNSIEGATDGTVSRSSYASQIECTNALVTDVVAAMPRDSLIFITGDHGPRWAGKDPISNPDASDSEVLNRVGILTAYRFPSRCAGIPDDASLMSATRFLFDCLGVESPIEREGPQRFYSQKLEAGSFSVTDITDRVNELD